MSSRKRPSSNVWCGRTKRKRSSLVTSKAAVVSPEAAAGTSTRVDVEALTATITAAVTSAVQAAMKAPVRGQPPAEPPVSATQSATMAPISAERAVSDQLAIISPSTEGTKETSPNGASSKLENSEKLVFSLVLPSNWEEPLLIRSRPKSGPTSM